MLMPLSQLASVDAGCVFRSRIQPDPHGSVPVIQMKDIQPDHRIGGIDLVVVRPSADLGRYVVQADDVLLASRGSRFPAAVVTEPAAGAVPISLFHILRLRRPLRALPAYLVWFLNLPEAQDYFHAHAAGSGIPFVSRETAGKLLVPVPPIERQERFIAYYQLVLSEDALTARLTAARRRLLLGHARGSLLSDST